MLKKLKVQVISNNTKKVGIPKVLRIFITESAQKRENMYQPWVLNYAEVSSWGNFDNFYLKH